MMGACAGDGRGTAELERANRSKARILSTMKTLGLRLKFFEGLVKTFPPLLKLILLPEV